ncbi:MAG: tetratricopeptide repeat protein, partial [Candidatus Aminicenantes bacterium]|nr:tetratricopeptide repeat protein [Candidatus Aminicenantes bacterium]
MQFKKIVLSTILISMTALIITAFGNQNAPEHKVLFEKARYTMETKGDLKGAIELFKEIIRKYPDDRVYAAKSQYYIGICYEKLGLSQAKSAFQEVVEKYPEQTEAVNRAKEKLSNLVRAAAVIENIDTELRVRRLLSGLEVMFDGWLGAVSPDGQYVSVVDWETGDLAIRNLITGEKTRLTNKGSWDESNE